MKTTAENLRQQGYVQTSAGVWEKPKFLPPDDEPSIVQNAPQSLANDARAPLTAQKTTDEQKLNKTEKAYLERLRMLGYEVGIQNITLKLADDCRYTCDFNFIDENGLWQFHEVKGFFRDDAKVKIKVAARLYRHLHFKVVKKVKQEWEMEEIKP